MEPSRLTMVLPSQMTSSALTVTLDIRRGSRGRPKAPWQSVSDVVSFAYLVRISKKYEIDTFRFLQCIHGAWIHGESICDGTSVRWRQMTGDIATFLITRDRKIIAQVRLNSRILGYLVRPELLKLRFEGYAAPKWKAPQAVDLEIKDLTSETKRFNLNAKVIEKSSPRTILTKWGDALQLSTATISDRSGTIKLPLWKDQVGTVSVGDRLRIENARLKRFRGELQVKLDRLTKLRIIENEQNKQQATSRPNGR